MRFWRLLFSVSLLLYVALGIYQLELPGVNQDEALDAVPAMQFVLGQPQDGVASIEIAGREWPLMVMPYISATSTYLFLPFYALFGISVATTRIAMLSLGFVTLLFMWGFLREYLDERVASLSVLLLAVNPTYLFWTRMGAYVALPMLPLAVLSLWMLFRWYQRRSARYLVLAALFLGLGLGNKILFVWWWVALGASWLLLSPWLRRDKGWRRWLWPLHHASPLAWVLSAGALVLGTGLMLVYNVPDFPTLRYVRRQVEGTELYGVDNRDVVGNLRVRLFEDFQHLLNGGWFEGRFAEDPHTNPLMVPAFVLALVVLGWLAWHGRLPYSTHRVALLVVLLVSILGQSIFTVTNFGANHLMILWPIPQALMATALFGVADTFSRHAHRNAVALAGLAALVLVASEAWTTMQYHRTIARTGGIGLFSDAATELARDLEANGTLEPIALDWGFRRNLQLLSRGRVNPIERFEYTQQPSTAFSDFIRWRVTQEPTLYLFHTPNATAFQGHWELWEEATYAQRLRPVLWKEYKRRDGVSIYRVYTVEEEPRLFEPPPMAFPVDAQLGDGLALLGYDLPTPTIQAGETLSVTLYWQALAPQTESYKVFAHLLDANGTPIAQHDGIPHAWGYPTTEWQEGEIVPDRIRLAIPAETAPGTYRLFIGMYGEATGERLPLVYNGQRQEGDTLQLAEVVVATKGG